MRTPSVKIAFRCGTSAMFRLVMNPKMKNSAVTVMNGTRYPGEVSADDCFVSVAMSVPRFLKKLSPVRARLGAPVA